MSGENKHTTTESEAVATSDLVRLRWSAACMVVVFVYGLLAVMASIGLALDERWEFWIVVPLPGTAIFSLWNWWLFFKEPNVPDQATAKGRL